MENTLYRFLADRNTSILDNIKRYCISENKNELDIIRTVFYFLEGIKRQLDDSFVKTCLGYILENANEDTKKAFMFFNANQVHCYGNISELDGELKEQLKARADGEKEQLKAIEGKKGDITELMYYLLTTNKTEFEKVLMLKEMVARSKDVIYMTILTGLYISEESGIEIGYTNHIGQIITHIYTRLEFIQDYDIVAARYDVLAEKYKLENPQKKGEDYEKRTSVLNMIKPRIIRDDNKVREILEYLDDAQKIINLSKGKKEIVAAVSLAFWENNIFKDKPTFEQIINLLSCYWGVVPPAYKKPGKYQKPLLEIKARYHFIDRGLNHLY